MDFSAVIMVPAIAGSAIVGFLLGLLASNGYLQVLQGTAAGARIIEWPSETIPDHFIKLLYIAWVFVLVFGPSYIVGRSLGSTADSRLAFTLIIFWLVFPICQLSSLGGPTVWLPFWPELFMRLRQKPGEVLSFYLVSGVILAALALFAYLTFRAPLLFLFIGAPLLVICWLHYARAIGRLAFVLRFTRATKSLRKKKPGFRRERSILIPPPSTSTEKEATDRRRVQQPTEQAPIQTPDEGALHGYNVRFEDEPPPPRPSPVMEEIVPPGELEEVVEEPELVENPELVEDEPEDLFAAPSTERRRQLLDRSRQWDEEDDDATAYGAHAPEVTSETSAPKEVVKPKESEMRLLKRDEPKKPRRYWTPDLLTYVLHPATANVVVSLTFLTMVVAGFIRLARAFAPAAD